MANFWMRWCRLCAREDPDNSHINIFIAEEEELPLCVTINLYFSVDINYYNNFPSMICADCYHLIRTTMNLSNRVSRVTAMFTELLHESVEEDDLKKIKARYNVESDFKIFSSKKKEREQEDMISETDNIIGDDQESMACEDSDINPFDIKIEGEEDNYDGLSFKEYSSADEPSEDQFEELKEDYKSRKDDDEESKEYYCSGCNKGFRRFFNYRRHMENDHNIAVVEWPSSEEKPFKCRYCDKILKSQHCLKHHEDTHDETKYVCVVCGQQLNTQQTLRNHMVVHSDIKNHKCEYCGKKYKRKKALKAHLIIHSGLKPYSCYFCDKTYASASNCRAHMKKIHPEELAAQDSAKSGEIIPKVECI